MTENFNYLFQYLEKEYIKVDKTEFLFQIQSHPDYPSILSIADALSFFSIKNCVIRVDSAEIELLPEHFIAVLTEENDRPTLDTALYFVEQNGANYFCTKDKKASEIAKAELESRWNGIVLLVEKSENEEDQKLTKNHWFWVLQIFALVLFLLVLFQNETAFTNKLFLVFPIVGILFSIAALKDLFGAKSELLNNFCNMTASTSCSTVVGSTKWKIFEIVNFSDLCMVFFSSQFLGLLVFLFSGDVAAYFAIQKMLLLSAIPVLFLSVYYQKFVEKKWCPICLVIISIVLFELSYLFVFQNIAFTISAKALVIFGFVFLSVIIIWSALKKLFMQQKELKEFQLKGIRFMHNYEVFKNSLMASEKTNYQPLSSGNLIVGNENANLKITLVSNPFCGYCAEAHTLIKYILKKHKNSVCVDFRFNFNIEHSNEQIEKVHQKLVRIYYDNGQEAFLEALHNWFENKDETKLIVSEKSLMTNLKINEILQEQYLMNQVNAISFTPSIMINQHQFPKMYDRKELIHFINDLLEDEF